VFDLDDAVRTWKKDFLRQEAFDDGALRDMEMILRDAYESGRRAGLGEEEAFRGAAAQVGTAATIAGEYRKNLAAGLDRRAPLRPARFLPALAANHLKVALRKIRRRKAYSLLNAAGLSLGFACGILAFLFIRFERSYDRYHKHAGDISRVVYTSGSRQGTTWGARTPGLLKPTLVRDFPDIVRACRIRPWEAVVKKDDRVFNEKSVFLADPEYLDMFSCPLASGDARMALAEPYALLLTEAAAAKYFGRENPVGRVLNLDDQDYRVTGVVKNPPQNTHFHFDMLISFATLSSLLDPAQIDNWNQFAYATYIQLRPGASAAGLAARLPEFARRRIDARYRVDLRLQPLTDIHLHGAMSGELEPNGDIRYVYLLGAIALIVLIVACLNYMNLATALSAGSAREVGLRKVVGAGRASIARRFLGESIVMAVLSLALSLLVVQIALPAFNALVGRDLNLRALAGPIPIALLAALTAVVGLTAGSYPAVFLSAFRPAAVLRGSYRESRRKSSAFRRLLVVVQFTVSIALVACTLIVHRQLRFIQSQRMGYDADLVVAVPVTDESIRRNPDALRQALLEDPRVGGVAFSSDLPSAVRSSSYAPLGREGKTLDLRVLDVDAEFLDFYGLKILRGRGFSRDIPSDAQGAVILNQAAVRALAPADPLQAKLAIQNYPPSPVVGIVQDFHYAPLTQMIEPLAINILPRYEGRYFSIQYASIRIGPEDVRGALAFIEKTFRRIAPGSPFAWSFLDDQIAAMYAAETKLAATFDVFAGLALGVACLGLLGLASYIAERRTKEIGIRRVFGASPAGIAALLNRELVRWVAAAALIACPLAYAVMQGWMRRFAYRASVTPWIFLQAAVLALAAALLTTGWRTVKAVRANPARSLKYE